MCQIISLGNFSKVPYLNIVGLFCSMFPMFYWFFKGIDVTVYVCIHKREYILLYVFMCACLHIYVFTDGEREREVKLLLEPEQRTTSELGKN